MAGAEWRTREVGRENRESRKQPAGTAGPPKAANEEGNEKWAVGSGMQCQGLAGSRPDRN